MLIVESKNDMRREQDQYEARQEGRVHGQMQRGRNFLDPGRPGKAIVARHRPLYARSRCHNGDCAEDENDHEQCRQSRGEACVSEGEVEVVDEDDASSRGEDSRHVIDSWQSEEHRNHHAKTQGIVDRDTEQQSSWYSHSCASNFLTHVYRAVST